MDIDGDGKGEGVDDDIDGMFLGGGEGEFRLEREIFGALFGGERVVAGGEFHGEGLGDGEVRFLALFVDDGVFRDEEFTVGVGEVDASGGGQADFEGSR